MSAHISKIPSWLSQGSLGGHYSPQTQVFPAGEQHQPSPRQVCSTVSSPVPSQQAPDPSPVTHTASPPPSHRHTAWGTYLYKSRVYCHFYLNLHNCVTTSDVKRDVPSLPRELAEEGGGLRSTGRLPPTPRAGAQPLARLCPGQPGSSQRCRGALSWWMPERGESVPSFGPLAALATQLQPLAVPVLPRIPQLYRDGHGWPRAGHPTASWAPLMRVFIHRYSYRRRPN